MLVWNDLLILTLQCNVTVSDKKKTKKIRVKEEGVIEGKFCVRFVRVVLILSSIELPIDNG